MQDQLIPRPQAAPAAAASVLSTAIAAHADLSRGIIAL